MKEKMEKLNKMLQKIEAPFHLEIKTSWKNNSPREGFALVSNESTTQASPMLYYGEWCEQTNSNIIDFLMDVWKKNSFDVDISAIEDFGYVVTNVVPRLISKKNIQSMKQHDIMYHEYLNMCVTYAINIAVPNGDGMAQVVVTNKLFEKYNISEADFKEIALCNAAAHATVENLGNMMMKMGCPFPINSNMWIISNQDKYYGSASILIPEIQDEIKNILGDKVVILPSSIHECIAISYESEDDLEEYLDFVGFVNETTVAPEDRLTDAVYLLTKNGLQTY